MFQSPKLKLIPKYCFIFYAIVNDFHFRLLLGSVQRFRWLLHVDFVSSYFDESFNHFNIFVCEISMVF